jgi:hypothetical protein
MESSHLSFLRRLILHGFEFFNDCFSGDGLDLHGHAELAVVVGAVEVCDVGHVALEALVADLAEEDLALLALLVLLDPPYVLLDVQVLLATHQQASLQSALSLDHHRLLLLLALGSLLDPIFLTAPLVSLSGDGALKLRWLAHLL